MMTEEDVKLEVEAVQAVYSDDCHLICAFPPHLIVHIKPRTADDSSQQFVEAAIVIKANTKYPEEPPHIYIADMKGMDDGRQVHLITSIQKRAHELSSCPMLIALCEEAVDVLTNMNHPEGDCPVCLYPLVSDDRSHTILPFMKLMSCYHCFHSECMIRLWKWIHEKNETNKLNQTLETAPTSIQSQRDETSQMLQGSMSQQNGHCPVCRKVFNAKDIEHVLEYFEEYSPVLNPVDAAALHDEEEKAVLLSELEKKRKQKFEAILKLQLKNKGLIESRKDLTILPGMFLPEPPTTAARAKDEQFPVRARNRSSEANGDGVSVRATANRDGISVRATANKHQNSNRGRKGNLQGFKVDNGNAESSRKQWVVKPLNASKQ